MDDAAFRNAADQALDDLFQRLTAVCDDYGFEPDLNAGALTIEFEAPRAKFVVSPNSPVRQIWVSANVQSYKLDWDPAKSAFCLAGENLAELMASAIGKHLGKPVEL